MNVTALLVFARAAGLTARAPGFSHPSVPPVVRVGFAFALAAAVAPTLTASRDVPPVELAFAIAGEVIVGALMGFGASLLYDGAYFAGRTIDDYLGVRSSVPNANVTSAQAFARLWSSMFLAAFVLLDGWVPVVRVFADSFAHVPPAGTLAVGDLHAYALALPRAILTVATIVAAPAIAVACALQIAVAAVGRVVPRFASFTLGFPIVFAAALLVTIAALPLLTPLGAHPWLVMPWAR